MSELGRSFRLNERLGLFISYALVIGMMVCLSISVTQVLQRFAPDLRLGFLPWIGFLVALEGMYTQRTWRRLATMEVPVVSYRVVECVVILVVIKVLSYGWLGVERFLQDVPAWAENFSESFFNAEYIIGIFTAIAVWGLSVWYSMDLDEMEGDEALLKVADLGGYSSNRGGVREGMVGRFLTVGFIMVLMVGVMNIDLTALIVGKVSMHRSSAFNILLYFMFGLLLLSLTHFAILRAGWAWERIPIDPQMGKRWIAYSLVTLLGVVLISFFLPTDYSLGLLETVGYVLSVIFSFIYGLFLLILTPVFWLLGWLLRILRSEEITELQPEQPKLPEIPESLMTGPDPFWMLLQSILFWTVFVGVIVYAFYLYLKQNRELYPAQLIERLRKVRGFRLLADALHWLRGRVKGFNQAVAAMVGAGIERVRAIGRRTPLEALRFINPRRLSPRERVRFFYLAMVRRGSESGLERKPTQTPYEYVHKLEDELPEASDTLAGMTEAFVEARYTQHEITPEQAGWMRRWWQQIRQAFQEWRLSQQIKKH